MKNSVDDEKMTNLGVEDDEFGGFSKYDGFDELSKCLIIHDIHDFFMKNKILFCEKFEN